MMALILSVCFVVDDAIVMLEDIVRHIEAGLTPLEAAYKGSKEIGFTILPMTLSLAAVWAVQPVPVPTSSCNRSIWPPGRSPDRSDRDISKNR